MESKEEQKEVIRALRCSASPKHSDCTVCKYRYLEEVSDKIPCPPDLEIDGKKYWESCDCERVSMDAADLIERLCERYNQALEKQIPKVPDYEGDGMSDGQIIIDMWACPNCGKKYEVDYDDYEYCPKCGQHIDHSTLTED